MKSKRQISVGALLVTFIWLLLSLFSTKGFSQTLNYYRGSDCTFTTSDNVAAGCTSNNYFFVQYQDFPNGLNLPAGWTLKVKANNDFSNGSATIPAQYVSIGFNSVDGGPGGVSGTGNQALSKTTPAALISTSAALQSPPYYYFVHKLNMTVAGGSHLLAGTGTFSTTLTITLVAANGTIVSTNSSVAISFTVNYSNSCSGVTMSAYSSNQYTFADYNAQMAGATITDAASIQYSPNSSACNGWSLKVRALGDFVNGGNSVAASFFSIRFNRVASGSPTAAQIGVGSTPVTLSTTDAALINNSAYGFTPYNGTEHKFDLIIAGGNHLLVASGTYRATLAFTLYNQNNQVVATANQELSFQVNSTPNNYTIQLQNAANLVDMVFNTNADFINGISVIKTRGLKVTGYSAYQLLVKTTSNNLDNGNSSTIPVAAVNVEATLYSSITGTIGTNTRALSTSDQVLITNPLANYTQQIVEYNLRYYINGGDSRLTGKTGTFSTNVIFVAIPQ